MMKSFTSTARFSLLASVTSPSSSLASAGSRESFLREQEKGVLCHFQCTDGEEKFISVRKSLSMGCNDTQMANLVWRPSKKKGRGGEDSGG